MRQRRSTRVDAALVDYIGVGPVHETPTKPGRPAVGRRADPLRGRARAACRSSRSAGCDDGNLAEALDAGATRVCVLRAIAGAEDPERGALRPRRCSRSASGSSAQPGAERRPRRRRDELARAALSRSARTSARGAAGRDRVCVVLALGVLAGALSVHDLEPPRRLAARARLFLAAVLALLAQGMYRRRYWAVLGFEALLAFQIIVTSLALVVASTITAAGVCVVSVGLGGWLFWKLVRVMGRIQAGERRASLR